MMQPFFEQLEVRLCFSGETGLRGDYYQSSNDVFSASSQAVTQAPFATNTSATVNVSPAPSASEIRWSGQIKTEAAGNYVFHVVTNGGVRLWVNNQLILNSWTSGSTSSDRASSSITLSANSHFNIRLDVIHATTGVELEWVMPNGTKQVIPQAQLYPFSKPIYITSGGIYVGSWESTADSQRVVDDHTTQPVTIEDSTIRGTGELIQNSVANTQLTVLNNYAYGMDPTVAGDRKGDFVYVQNAANLVIENNNVEHVGGYGIKVYGFTGTGSQTIKIVNNYILDSDGRDSNGHGGYETANVETHSIGIQNVYNVAGMTIAWNYIENDPGISDDNDVISLFEVSGTAASPMNVEDNYVFGLYDLNYSTTWDSGSGITTDGDPAAKLALEPAYINIHDNEVVQTGSAGIGVPTGHNISIYNNRLLNTGYVPDGTMNYSSGTGVYIDDLNHTGSSLFYNNGAYNNLAGWVEPPHSQQNGGSGAQRRDYSFVNATASLTHGNSSMGGTINAVSLTAEVAFWQAKLVSNKEVVGFVALPSTVAQLAPAIMVASSSAETPAIAVGQGDSAISGVLQNQDPSVL